MALEFSVCGLAGELCKVNAAMGDTVEQLKMSIQDKTGIMRAAQRLFHEQHELQKDLLAFVPGRCVVLNLIQRSTEQAQWLQGVYELATPYDVRNWMRLHAQGAALEDRDVLLAALAKRGSLEFAPADLRADRKIALSAVTHDGLALKYLSPELRADREVVLEAVSRNRFALFHASAALRADRGFILAAVARRGLALEHASSMLQSDSEVVLAAVASHGCALEFASPDLQEDREVVLAAVTQHGSALEFAARALRADRAVVRAAVAQDANAIRYRAPELWWDDESGDEI